MRIVVGALLLAAFQCGQAPASPGSSTPESTDAAPKPSDPTDRVLGTQPPTVCEGWSPSPEPDRMEAEQLVARSDHACVRISSGRVRCWGSNSSGQLGTCEDLPHSAVPQTFVGVESARDVAVGRYGTCVVDDAGALWCSGHVRGLLGADGPGRIDGIADAKAVAIGDAHACVLQTDGRILCFGRWDAAEALGPRARVVEGETSTGRGAGFIELERPEQLVAGSAHNCALEGQGRVMCWGQNTQGQLGDPTVGAEVDSNRGVPRRVASMPFVQSIHAEQNTTCAVTDVGELFCWGEGFGPQAMGVRVPSTRAAAMGPGFVCLATTDGGLWCGGENMSFAPDIEAGFLPGYTGSTGVAVGEGFVCAHRRDGIVQCQGRNDLGQLGGQHAKAKNRLQPTKVLLGGVAI
jgi:alpha-tubulin suppressor-like RCC1 family protein